MRKHFFAEGNQKNDVLKLSRRSEKHVATVWINLISDLCSSQLENPNNLDCLNPKKVWLKGMHLRCPNFQGLFTTRVIKSHVKLHVKFDAQKGNCIIVKTIETLILNVSTANTKPSGSEKLPGLSRNRPQVTSG